jgi:hypothetical protein
MPTSKLWNVAFTAVQLSYSFVTGDEARPLQIGRTFLTFYDFDTVSRPERSQPAQLNRPKMNGA